MCQQHQRSAATSFQFRALTMCLIKKLLFGRNPQWLMQMEEASYDDFPHTSGNDTKKAERRERQRKAKAMTRKDVRAQ